MSRFFDATLATEDEDDSEPQDDEIDDEDKDPDAEESDWDSSIDDAQRIEHYTDE